MTHQPYEDWLLDEPNMLPMEQASELKAHLANCTDCRSLAEALGQVELRLRQEPQVSPVEGFSLRWQERLEAERLSRHRRQTWLALVLGVATLALLIAVVAVAALPLLQAPDDAFWTSVVRYLNTLGWLQNVGRFMVVFLGACVNVLPVVLWIFGLGVISELGVLWIVSYRLLTNPRRVLA